MINLQSQLETDTNIMLSGLTPEITANLINAITEEVLCLYGRLKHHNFHVDHYLVYGSVGDVDVMAIRGPDGPHIITSYDDRIRMATYTDYYGNGRTEFPVNDLLKDKLKKYFKDNHYFNVPKFH
jgi:hypothetical protein